MPVDEPATQLDARFSNDGAIPTTWAEGRQRIEKAELFWLTTVRPDGRPHVTPVIAVWLDGIVYFCTGPTERKAKNLEGNRDCILTTGSNELNSGLDVVIEGEAERVTDNATLGQVADAYETKYGEAWRVVPRDASAIDAALVFRVIPTVILGFAKGAFSQTRWRFATNDPQQAPTGRDATV